jgi:hypothetical protein
MTLSVAYLLGAVYRFGAEGNGDFIDTLLRFPAGNVILICGSLYMVMWCFDYWKLVKRDTSQKAKLALQILVLLALLFYLLR